MDDLVSRLLEAIGETEREAPWTHHKSCASLPVEDDPVTYDCDCGVPASVLRRCAADRRRLERHAPTEPGIGHFGSARFKDPSARICAHCSHDGDWGAMVWPCPDFVDLADSYGLEVTE